MCLPHLRREAIRIQGTVQLPAEAVVLPVQPLASPAVIHDVPYPDPAIVHEVSCFYHVVGDAHFQHYKKVIVIPIGVTTSFLCMF